jgi:serine/threonine-protein kinase RsbW
MVIPARPTEIPTVTEGVLQLLRDKKWTEDEIIEVELALQEALANAIRHGAKGDPSQKIQCCVTCDEAGEMMVVVRDPGSGFDETKVANPLHPENMLKPSGRGIFLINQLMDEVQFADGGREIQMKKKKD